jgi:hypothetical protein
MVSIPSYSPPQHQKDRNGFFATGLFDIGPGQLPPSCVLSVFQSVLPTEASGQVHHADLPEATKADIEAHFASHGTGEITEIKLMNGFGFIEYKDAMDARDVVPGESLPPSPSPSAPCTYHMQIMLENN